jgi:hypothetical protein
MEKAKNTINTVDDATLQASELKHTMQEFGRRLLESEIHLSDEESKALLMDVVLGLDAAAHGIFTRSETNP